MSAVTFWLSVILIFMIPWENAITFEGFGTIGRAVGFLVLFFWIVTVAGRGQFRKLKFFHLAVFIFVLWNILSIMWTLDVDRTTNRIFTYIQIFGFVLILWDLYKTRAALTVGLQAYILGAYVSIVAVVINFMTDTHSHVQSRYTGTGFNENAVAFLLALGIPLAWHLATSDKNNTKKYIRAILSVLNFAYIPSAIFAILLTASRGGFICIFPGLLFIFGSITKLKLHQCFAIFAALGALLLFTPSIPESSLTRLSTIGDSFLQGDLGGRGSFWQESLIVFLEHPILGVGSYAYKTISPSGNIPHNTFISVLVEGGVIGFSIFMTILAFTIYYALKQSKWYSRLWLTILLIWFLDVNTFAWEYRKATWLFFSLIIISANLSQTADEEESKISLTPIQ